MQFWRIVIVVIYVRFIRAIDYFSFLVVCYKGTTFALIFYSFFLFNVDGYFHHLVEYLKAIAAKGFADPLPFIVVDDSNELSVVFRLLKLRYKKGKTTAEAYAATRQLIYELPYFLKKKTDSSVHVEDIIAEMDAVEKQGSAEQKQELANEIEKAYLEKEIERM